MSQIIVDSAMCLFLSAIATVVHAQAGQPHAADPALKYKNEVGLVIGATLTPSVALKGGGNVNLNSSLALGAEYDRHLIGHDTALYAGIDFLASPFDVKASFPPADVTPQYAYLFLTPHVRVKFNENRAWQPWLLFGGGYSDFAPKQPPTGNVHVTGSGSSGALVFGGGVDTKPLVHLNLPVVGKLPIGTRFEAREFLSGQPNYGVATTSSLQNNVTFTGGLLLRF